MNESPGSERRPGWVDGVFLVTESGPRAFYPEFDKDFGMEFFEVELSRFVNAAPGLALGLGLAASGALLPMYPLTALGTLIIVVVSIQHKLFGRTVAMLVKAGREAKQEAYRHGQLVEGELRSFQVSKGRNAKLSYRYRYGNETYHRSLKVRLSHSPGHPTREEHHLVEAVLQRAQPGACIDVLVNPASPELAVPIYKSIRGPGSARPPA